MPLLNTEAPVGGWNANNALDSMPPQDAVRLINLVPDAGYVRSRGGSRKMNAQSFTAGEADVSGQLAPRTLVPFKEYWGDKHQREVSCLYSMQRGAIWMNCDGNDIYAGKNLLAPAGGAATDLTKVYTWSRVGTQAAATVLPTGGINGGPSSQFTGSSETGGWFNYSGKSLAGFHSIGAADRFTIRAWIEKDELVSNIIDLWCEQYSDNGYGYWGWGVAAKVDGNFSGLYGTNVSLADCTTSGGALTYPDWAGDAGNKAVGWSAYTQPSADNTGYTADLPSNMSTIWGSDGFIIGEQNIGGTDYVEIVMDFSFLNVGTMCDRIKFGVAGANGDVVNFCGMEIYVGLDRSQVYGTAPQLDEDYSAWYNRQATIEPLRIGRTLQVAYSIYPYCTEAYTADEWDALRTTSGTNFRMPYPGKEWKVAPVSRSVAMACCPGVYPVELNTWGAWPCWFNIEEAKDVDDLVDVSEEPPNWAYVRKVAEGTATVGGAHTTTRVYVDDMTTTSDSYWGAGEVGVEKAFAEQFKAFGGVDGVECFWIHNVTQGTYHRISAVNKANDYYDLEVAAPLAHADNDVIELYEFWQPLGFQGGVSFKGRVYYWVEGEARFWYTDVNQHKGVIEPFNLDNITKTNGYIHDIVTWTRDGGDGMDDMLVFIMNTGECLVYQGDNPGSISAWSLVGSYQIAEPVGNRSVTQVGSDNIILTKDGYLNLSAAMGDGRYSEASAYSIKIVKAAKRAATAYKDYFGWEATLHPAGSLFLVNVPIGSGLYEQHVRNTNTGAWCKFTDWNCPTMVVWDDLLIGSNEDGYLYQLDVGTSDDGDFIDFEAVPAYQHPTQRQTRVQLTACELVTNYQYPTYITIEGIGDYDNPILPLVPEPPEQAPAEWDLAVWDVSPWDSQETRTVTGWQGVMANGYAVAVNIRFKSRAQRVFWYSTNYLLKAGGSM